LPPAWKDVGGLDGELRVAAVVVLVEAQAAAAAVRHLGQVGVEVIVDLRRLEELVGGVGHRGLHQPARVDDAVVAQGLAVAAVLELAEAAFDVGRAGLPA